MKWAALDLSGPYRRVYEIALPNATQVADPFHVVKLANTKLDLVRQRVQTEQLGHRGRKHDPLYRAASSSRSPVNACQRTAENASAVCSLLVTLTAK